MQREVAASRLAWPGISAGLPRAPSHALGASVAAAARRASALVEPAFVASARTLTGPASGIGGIYESYERLAKQGWQMTSAALAAIASAPSAHASFAHASVAHASVAQGSFARQNSPLYIDAIYDGHFDLSLLGKSMLSGYQRLGGASAFGGTLTQSEVDALAGAYSIGAVRLQPHPSGTAKEG